MMKQTLGFLSLAAVALLSCNSGQQSDQLAPVSPNALKPVIVTDTVAFDTDDPAIWINKQDTSKSLIIGTDKEVGGGLYAFDLQGKIVKKITGMQRPNNVDVAYGLMVNNQPVDIAVFTDRKSHTIRVVRLPEFEFIDNGGIPVFEGESGDGFRDGMGIAMYQSLNGEVHAIVGRKNGKSGEYLWQYKLQDDGSGVVTATVVRKFGQYSGKKEIEAIAVDHKLGYVYYCDEQVGVRKYFADPAKGNDELALFGQKDFKEDNEGISFYETSPETGYIFISNQQDNSFNVYAREGKVGNPHQHELLATIPLSTIESDGSDMTNIALPGFPNGLLVAMSNGKVFHYYDWNQLKERIPGAN